MAVVDSTGSDCTLGQRPGTWLRRAGDILFERASLVVGLCIVLLIIGIGFRLFAESAVTRHLNGWATLTQTDWDVSQGHFGSASFIFGTLVSSSVALVVAIPISLGAALFLTQVAPKRVATPISFAIELLAAVPSIVYGLWGFAILCPFLQTVVGPWLQNEFGANPLFAGPPVLTNMLAAGLILSVMIMPIITAISSEVIRTIPRGMISASTGLGATRWETIKLVVMPSSKAGIMGACILGLGRALGETMAVVMVIGNNPQIKASLLQPGYSMAGKIANEFGEAAGDKTQRSALIELALILFVITLLVNVVARLIIHAAKGSAGKQAKPAPEPIRRLQVLASNIMGQYGTQILVLGFTSYQIFCDYQKFGAAAWNHGFERLAIIGVVIWLASGMVRFERTRFRHFADWMSRIAFTASGLFACLVLGAVLFHVTMHGMKGLTPSFFTETPKAVGEAGGGMKHAILGTALLVLIASVFGIPIGLLAGIYASEFSTGKLGEVVRFSAEVLNGIPSVICGIFAYAAFVLPFGHFSAWAGGLSLAVIMIPTVALTTEDMLRLVPRKLRQAAYGLGASRSQMVRTVIFPAARAGILTGVILAIARVAGETAPLLFTAFGSRLVNMNPSQPVESLTMQIYDYSLQPSDDLVQQAWTGALVLLLFVLAINLLARLLVARSSLKTL